MLHPSEASSRDLPVSGDGGDESAANAPDLGAEGSAGDASVEAKKGGRPGRPEYEQYAELCFLCGECDHSSRGCPSKRQVRPVALRVIAHLLFSYLLDARKDAFSSRACSSVRE